jgi:NADH:ubiquinone oxidoreductase subunit
MNLYFNNILSIKEKKEFKYINSDEISKHFNTCYLVIKDFWKELYNNKELVYKLMKFSKIDELINSYLNIFFMQNFYINLFSYSDGFPNELYFLINRLLKDLIDRINTTSEYSAAFEESVLSYLIDGMILNDNVRCFFNLILSDIIEQYENSKESIEILFYKVKDIKDYFKNQEEKIKQEYLTANKPKKSEIEKQKKRQKSFLFQIYKMKLPNIKNTEKLNDNIIDLEDIIDRDYKNNEVFANKYLPELNKKELIELVNKEENDIMKNYINYQIDMMNNDNSIYSNKKFLENIQKCSESEKFLYFYQKSFMISINIIKQIFQKLNENIELVPEEIKFISFMIKQSLKEKFNSIKNNEIYIYVSGFFIRIFKAYFLHPDYNALITSIILSKHSKDNFKKIYDIILKLVSGSFYKSTKEECDYTPYNLFFLEIMPEVHKFCEKLLENETFRIRMENLEKNQNLNHMKKNMNSNTIVYNIHQITSILNIINHNYNNFFANNENDEFLKIFKMLKENKDIFNEIKKKEKEENKIFFFAYNEIIYSPKLLNIMNSKKDKYFKIEELEEDKTREEVTTNKIIRAKNLIFDLLYISPKLSKLETISINFKGKNTKEILAQLNKYYKGINTYTQNDEKKNKLNNTNEKSKIPKEWYINALLVCLDNLDEDYSKNDYEKLYISIKEDINISIKNYDFEELTRILKDLNAISRFKDIFIKLQEIYKDNMINIKIRDFIENEPLEILIKFIYNNANSNKVFNITKINTNLNSSRVVLRV